MWNYISFHHVSLAEEIASGAFGPLTLWPFDPAPTWTSSGLPGLPTTWDSQDYFCGSHPHGGRASHSEASFLSRVAWKPHWHEIFYMLEIIFIHSTCTSGKFDSLSGTSHSKNCFFFLCSDSHKHPIWKLPRQPLSSAPSLLHLSSNSLVSFMA